MGLYHRRMWAIFLKEKEWLGGGGTQLESQHWGGQRRVDLCKFEATWSTGRVPGQVPKATEKKKKADLLVARQRRDRWDRLAERKEEPASQQGMGGTQQPVNNQGLVR